MPRCSHCGRRWSGPHPQCTPSETYPEPPLVESFPTVPGHVLERVLGRGGFATVYAARRSSDGLRVALKVGRTDQVGGAAALRNEVSALTRVGPPHVPAVLSVDTENASLPFFSMELIEAPTVAALLEQREWGLPFDVALPIAISLTTALAAIHRRGVMHLDLKPENIFACGSPPVARIIDFGVARFTDQPPPPDDGRTLAGTAEYMAPEQCESRFELLSPRTDVYALGAILYELVSGRPPFWGRPAEVKQAHQSHRPPPLSSVATVPAEFERLVMRCLGKDPSARFESCEELAEGLSERTPTAIPVVATQLAANAPAPVVTKPAMERPLLALLFFESTAQLGEVQSAVSAAGGELASVSGRRYVAAFGQQPSGSPARRAVRVAERMLDAKLSARLVLDLARVSAQIRPDGSRRLLSPLFSRPDRFPTPNEPIGLQLTEDAVAALPELSVEPGPSGRRLLCRGVTEQTGTDFTRARSTEVELFGRSRELETLLESAKSGQPALAVVCGAAGMGKSRLMRALATGLKALGSTRTVLAFRAHEPVAGEPNETLKMILTRALGVRSRPEGPWEQALAESHLGAQLTRDAQLAVALVMGWVSPEHPELARLASAPGVLSGLASRAVGEGLRNLARSGPLHLLLDDAHWAEAPALNALQYAALPEAELPVWLCLASRPGSAQALAGSAEGPQLDLPPLTHEDALAMCRALLAPAEHVPAQALEKLLTRARSVPLQLVELIHHLKHNGLVRRHQASDTWYLATDELDNDAEVPVLEWVTQRELRALPADLLAHARLAAMLGTDFGPAELEGVLAELDREGLGHLYPLDSQVGLRRLVGAELLIRHRDGRLSFRSGLLRDALLAGVEQSASLRTHAAALRFYRHTLLLTEGERLARKAMHAEKAGLGAEAGRLYFELAEDGRRRHAYLDAENTYSRAVKWLPPDDLRSHLVCRWRRGQMRHRLGRHSDALADFADATERAKALGDVPAQVQILLEEATALDWMGKYSLSADRAEQAARLAGDTSTPVVEANLLMARGRSTFRASDNVRAAQFFEQAVRRAEEAGDEAYESLVVSLLLLGPLYCMMNRAKDAEGAFERGLALTRGRGDRMHESTAITNRLMLWFLNRNAERAIDDIRQGLLIGRELGLVDIESRNQLNLGETIYQVGDVAQAMPYAKKTLQLVERFGGREDQRRAAPLILMARMYLYLGDEDTASKFLEETRALKAVLAAKSLGEILPSEEAFVRAIELCTRDAADAEWEAMEKYSDTYGIQQDPIEVREMRALAALRRGRTEEARTQLLRALALAESIPNLMEPRLRARLSAIDSPAQR